MKSIQTLLLLAISINLYSQKKIHGIVLGECNELKKGIEVFCSNDSLNFAVTNKYGEYNIKSDCDTCLMIFRLMYSINGKDTTRVYNNVKTASKRLNIRFDDPNFHCDWSYSHYFNAGYLSCLSFAPFGFYWSSNYLPSNFWFSYGFSFSTDIKNNNIYKGYLKYKFRNDFHDRAISVNSEWFDLKTENIKLAKFKSEYSSNYKFLYYKIGIGMYSTKEDLPFLATTIDLPLKILYSTFSIGSDWNLNRFDYQIGINSQIKRFLPSVKYTSLFDLKFWELSIGYKLK